VSTATVETGEPYAGWSNWSTWAVNLSVTNDYDTYMRFRPLALELDAEAFGSRLATALKQGQVPYLPRGVRWWNVNMAEIWAGLREE
jgi:hypothetical protein